jgi:hypothetical protein
MKKKSLLLILAIFSIFMITPKANAMTESQLKEKLSATYTINGKTVQATSAQIKAMEDYLNTYEVSESDCDYIANKFDEAINVLKENGATSVEELTASQKKELTAIVNSISSNTSVKASVDKNEGLIIKDPDGNVFYTAGELNVIKYTNHSYLMLIATGLITLAGVSLVIRKTKKVNE